MPLKQWSLSFEVMMRMKLKKYKKIVNLLVIVNQLRWFRRVSHITYKYLPRLMMLVVVAVG